MRLCSYVSSGSTRYEAVNGAYVVDLTTRTAPEHRTLDDFIAAIGSQRNVVEDAPNGILTTRVPRGRGSRGAALQPGEIPGVGSIASAQLRQNAGIRKAGECA